MSEDIINFIKQKTDECSKAKQLKREAEEKEKHLQETQRVAHNEKYVKPLVINELSLKIKEKYKGEPGEFIWISYNEFSNPWIRCCIFDPKIYLLNYISGGIRVQDEVCKWIKDEFGSVLNVGIGQNDNIVISKK
jgi:hypothetical protein